MLTTSAVGMKCTVTGAAATAVVWYGPDCLREPKHRTCFRAIDLHLSPQQSRRLRHLPTEHYKAPLACLALRSRSLVKPTGASSPYLPRTNHNRHRDLASNAGLRSCAGLHEARSPLRSHSIVMDITFSYAESRDDVLSQRGVAYDESFSRICSEPGAAIRACHADARSCARIQVRSRIPRKIPKSR